MCYSQKRIDEFNDSRVQFLRDLLKITETIKDIQDAEMKVFVCHISSLPRDFCNSWSRINLWVFMGIVLNLEVGVDVDLSHNKHEKLLSTARITTSKIFSTFCATSCRCSGEYGIKTRLRRSSFRRDARSSCALTKTTKETAATNRKTNFIV